MAIWFLASPGRAAVVGADANPLNLPPPRSEGKLGTVVLHGGGPLSDEIFEKFIELSGGKQARIVLIPSGTYVRGRKDGVDFEDVKAPTAEDGLSGSPGCCWITIACKRLSDPADRRPKA